jgi:hypothetical protein
MVVARDRRNEILMPQDKRFTGNAHLNVPGSSAEPVRQFAALARRPSRTIDTNDLTASLRSNGRRLGVGRVVSLCEGGMLLESSSDLEVGEISGFELAGPDFRYVGFAAVEERAAGAIGLRFLTWEGPADHSIRALVAARLSSWEPGSQAPRISFAEAGGDINDARSGRVAYLTGTTAGVAVDQWHGAPEATRALIGSETELCPRRADAYITDWS